MEIPRLLLKSFRSVLRRMRPHRSAQVSLPWVVLRAGANGLTIQVQDTETALSVQLNGPRPAETLVLPVSVLADLGGRTGDVSLQSTAAGKVQVRWIDGTVPRVAWFNGTEPPAGGAQPIFAA